MNTEIPDEKLRVLQYIATVHLKETGLAVCKKVKDVDVIMCFDKEENRITIVSSDPNRILNSLTDIEQKNIVRDLCVLCVKEICEKKKMNFIEGMTNGIRFTIEYKPDTQQVMIDTKNIKPSLN